MPRQAGFGGLLSHAHADIFQSLRVSASIVSRDPGWPITDREQWRLLYDEPNVVPFELQHGVEGERYRYNGRCLTKVGRLRQPVLGTHAGLSDLFVPIVTGNRLRGVIVTGPFATARPTSTEVLERWRRISGNQGHPADSEFAHYLSTTLSTLVLDPDQVATFTRFLCCLAALIAGEGEPRRLLAEADAMRGDLDKARLVERVWMAARSMVDERTSRSWSSPHRAADLKDLGLTVSLDQVVVGLLVSLHHDSDPVDELLNRDAFQRVCVELARSAGGVISGQIGDHGVTFLAGTGGAKRKQQVILDIAAQARSLARDRFGMGLHLGMSSLPSSVMLSDHYEAALGAAESALSQRARLLRTAKGLSGRNLALGELRRQLSELTEEQPEMLPARFDRYLEVVAQRCGYRLEPARAHVEAGFDRISEALVKGGALEARSLEDTFADLERAAREARTVSDLFAAYRRVVVDLSEAVQRPLLADQDRRLRRAVTYIHRHYGEPLDLKAVARVAGFAPNYFSRLFRQRERMTLDAYLRQVRIERAKQLLAHTKLEVKRVAQLSGFASQHYFARVFKQVVGTTPLGWRQRG